jgi:hypothetical protein
MYLRVNNLFFLTTLTAPKKANKNFKSHDSVQKMFYFTCLQKYTNLVRLSLYLLSLQPQLFNLANCYKYISSLAGSKAAVFRAAPPERVPPAAARGRGVGRGGVGPGGGPAAAGRGRRHPPQPRPSPPPDQTCAWWAGRRRRRQRDSQARMLKVFDKGTVSHVYNLRVTTTSHLLPKDAGKLWPNVP